MQGKSYTIRFPKKTVLRAWEAPEGTSRVWNYYVVKDKKMVVMIPMRKEGAKALRVVVFPKPEHFEEFQRAKRGVKVGGPASNNPHGVGTLNVKFPLKGKSPEIEYTQAHFKTRGEFGLKRSLATYYGGWRQRALKGALSYLAEYGDNLDAFGEKRVLRIRKKLLSRRKKSKRTKKFVQKPTQLKHDVSRVCKDERIRPMKRGKQVHLRVKVKRKKQAKKKK